MLLVSNYVSFENLPSEVAGGTYVTLCKWGGEGKQHISLLCICCIHPISFMSFRAGGWGSHYTDLPLNVFSGFVFFLCKLVRAESLCRFSPVT